MKRSINITLTEIDNGILVGVGRNEGYGLTGGGSVVHCPNIDDATASAGKIAKARWELDRLHAAAAEEREARNYERQTGEKFPDDLREHTKPGDCMVREDPVMNTTAFYPPEETTPDHRPGMSADAKPST